MIGASPRQRGQERSRWWLAGIGQQLAWLRTASVTTVWRTLRALGVVYKRGRHYVHSPDPAYDAKLAQVADCLALARTQPARFVVLYQDELTYYRRPSLAQTFVPRGSDGPRAVQGWRSNRKRRIAATLDGVSGQVITMQAARCGRRELVRFYGKVQAAYPDAERIFIVQDNWPVHFHPEVLATVAASRLELVRLPTYAPWTNPIEKLWRWLAQAVLHLHAFADDWVGLQTAVTHWLAQFAQPSPDLLRYVGLYPV